MKNSFHRDKFYGPWHQTYWPWWRKTKTWKRVQKSAGERTGKKCRWRWHLIKTDIKSTVLSVVNGLLRIIFFSPVLNTGGGCCFLLLFSNQLSTLISLNACHFYRRKNCLLHRFRPLLSFWGATPTVLHALPPPPHTHTRTRARRHARTHHRHKKQRLFSGPDAEKSYILFVSDLLNSRLLVWIFDWNCFDQWPCVITAIKDERVTLMSIIVYSQVLAVLIILVCFCCCYISSGSSSSSST